MADASLSFLTIRMAALFYILRNSFRRHTQSPAGSEYEASYHRMNEWDEMGLEKRSGERARGDELGFRPLFNRPHFVDDDASK